MTCFRLAPLALALMLPAASFAQTAPAITDGTGDASAMAQMHAAMMGQADMEPGAMNHMAGSEHAMTVQEGGQSAFAAIQEIVTLLAADPNTDWASVDIEALRQHLIDMDNVTLRAVVTAIGTPTGAQFDAGSDDPAVAVSIRRMVLAHAATMNGANGWALEAMATDRGAELMVTGAPEDAVMIQGLGFIGILTLGMHHQAHHLALATGMNPHKQ
ncbi:MAG: hypothetical protein Q8Q26_00080 [Pseudorhodobacter sp.]|nr:hypothetical protein [Pseudorhodobacter sp.]